MRTQDAKPVQGTRYSYTYLMNLTKVIAKYVPLWNLWEGGSRGEGIIKYVKPRIRCVIKNWHVKLAENYLQENSMDQIIFKMKHDTSRNASCYITTDMVLWKY